MDKHIEKIRELKRDNNKLKKYKNFVEKSKDTKSIYDEIKNLKNQLEKYENLDQELQNCKLQISKYKTEISNLNKSELSFANKSNFYKQQMEINQLKDDKDKLNKNYKETFEKNKKLENIVEKLQDVFEDIEELY